MRRTSLKCLLSRSFWSILQCLFDYMPTTSLKSLHLTGKDVYLIFCCTRLWRTQFILTVNLCDLWFRCSSLTRKTFLCIIIGNQAEISTTHYCFHCYWISLSFSYSLESNLWQLFCLWYNRWILFSFTSLSIISWRLILKGRLESKWHFMSCLPHCILWPNLYACYLQIWEFSSLFSHNLCPIWHRLWK